MQQIPIPTSNPTPPAGFEFNPHDAAAIEEIVQALLTGRGSGVRMGPAGQLLPGRTEAKPGGYVAKGITAGFSVVGCYSDTSSSTATRNVLLRVQTSGTFTPKDGRPSRKFIGGGTALLEYRRG
jgi:hypothetical protein